MAVMPHNILSSAAVTNQEEEDSRARLKHPSNQPTLAVSVNVGVQCMYSPLGYLSLPYIKAAQLSKS